MSLLFLALSLLLREADLALELLLLEIASIRSRSRFSGSLSSSTFILLSGVRASGDSDLDLLLDLVLVMAEALWAIVLLDRTLAGDLESDLDLLVACMILL